MDKLVLEMEELETLETPISDFWEGFALGSGVLLTAAGTVAAIVVIT